MSLFIILTFDLAINVPVLWTILLFLHMPHFINLIVQWLNVVHTCSVFAAIFNPGNHERLNFKAILTLFMSILKLIHVSFGQHSRLFFGQFLFQNSRFKIGKNCFKKVQKNSKKKIQK